MTPSELVTNDDYYHHHTAWTRGYISRKNKNGIAVPYKGRFGEGYKVLKPSWDSTRFCHCLYYIKRTKG